MKWLPNRETLSRNGHASGCELILYPCLWRCHRVSLLSLLVGQEQQWWQQQQQQQGKPDEASSSLYAVYPCRYLTTSLRISLDCTLDLDVLSYGPQNKTIVLPQSDTFSCVFRLSLWLSALQASLCHDCRPLRAPAEVSWPLFDISPLGLFVVLTLCACTQASSIVNSTSYLFIILFIHSFICLSDCYWRSCTSPLLHPQS